MIKSTWDKRQSTQVQTALNSQTGTVRFQAQNSAITDSKQCDYS